MELLLFKDRVTLLDYFFSHLNIVIIPHDHDDYPLLQHQLNSIIDKLYHRISRIGIWSGTTMVQNAFDTKHRIPTMAELLYKNITRSHHATQHLIKLKQLVLQEIDFFNLLSNTDNEEHLSYLCSTVGNWAFPAHELSSDDLVYCAYLMINYALHQVLQQQHEQDGNFVKGLHFPNRNELLAIIFIVRDTYRSGNPFHNFRHAVDVLQACFHFLVRLGCLPQFKQFIIDPYQVENLALSKSANDVELIATNRVFSLVDLTQILLEAVGGGGSRSSTSSFNRSDSPTGSEVSAASTVKDISKPSLNLIQTLGLLVAALGHDVGHPGTTNAFMIKNRTPTSLVYNDRSVLESYHASIFINKVLNVCWPSLLQIKIEKDSLLNLHDLIVSSILATDMGEHFEYMSKLKNFSASTKQGFNDDGAGSQHEPMSNDNKIKLISALLIKCADISNVTRPLRVSSQWAVVLQREFDEVNQLDQLLNKQQQAGFSSHNDDDGNDDGDDADVEADIDTDTTTRSSISTSSIASFTDDAQGAEWFLELENEIEYEHLPFELNEILQNKPNIPLGQLFFIGTFAENLFNNISQVYPSLNYTCQIISDNKKYWLERKGELQM